jgi:ABC-type Zn uptake system ZnuABC Zn-binding protein ZnuA
MRIIPILIENRKTLNLKFVYWFCLVSSLLIGAVACGDTTRDSSSGKWHTEIASSPLRIITTIPMLEDWVNQVAGDSATVRSIIPHGVNPHSYQLGAKDVAGITESQILFAVGLGYESTHLRKLLENYPDIRVVELGEFVSPLEIDQNLKDDDHGHSILFDPHFWFDPMKVAIAAQVVAAELAALDPEQADTYTKRASAYSATMEELDNYIKKHIEEIPASNRVFMTSHESLGYLDARYDLDVVRAVMPAITSEKDIGPEHLVDAVQLIVKHDVRVIFLEDETSDRLAQVVARETGINAVQGLRVETLKGKTETYVSFMKDNIELIAETLKGSSLDSEG